MYHSVLMMDFKLTPCTLRYVIEISILAVFTTLWHLLVDSYLPNGRHSHSIHVYVEFYAYKGSKLMLAHEHFCQGQLMGNMFGRAGFKYVFSNTNTNTSFHIFQIQIQIRWKKKFKYKYKYQHTNTNTNTLRFYSNTNINIQIQIRFFTLYTNINISPNFSKMRRNLKDYWKLHLTPKQLETHGCILSTVATNAQVLKHQAISTHNAD